MQTFYAFVIIFISGIINPAVSQNRDVYWIHGLNGDNLHFRRYDNHFQSERQMNCHRVNYDTKGTVNQITDSVDMDVPFLPNNIAVGHSLGGIVARNSEVNGASSYGGVITLHSPNQGATIAANANDGRAQDFFEEVSNRLTRAVNEIEDHLVDDLNGVVIPLLNKLIRNVLNVIIVGFNDGGDWSKWIIQDIDEIELPDPQEELISAFDLLTDENLEDIRADLDPRSSFINDLNSFNSTLPRIEIHGYEDRLEVYRLACSTDEKVWQEKLALNTPHPDDCVINQLREVVSDLNLVERALLNRARLAHLCLWCDSGKYYEAARRVREARYLFNITDRFGDGFMDLVGRSWEFVTVSEMRMTADCKAEIEQVNREIYEIMGWLDECDLGYTPPNPYGNCQDLEFALTLREQKIDFLNRLENCYEYVEVQRRALVDRSNDPNDGFILEAEQITGSATDEYQNIAVNHNEALNHPESVNNFDEIWDSPGFFNTPR